VFGRRPALPSEIELELRRGAGREGTLSRAEQREVKGN
jgi:hypothetical protein